MNRVLRILTLGLERKRAWQLPLIIFKLEHPGYYKAYYADHKDQYKQAMKKWRAKKQN